MLYKNYIEVVKLIIDYKYFIFINKHDIIYPINYILRLK